MRRANAVLGPPAPKRRPPPAMAALHHDQKSTEFDPGKPAPLWGVCVGRGGGGGIEAEEVCRSVPGVGLSGSSASLVHRGALGR